MQVRIIWQGKGFYKAVAEAKRLGGTYDAETQTWALHPRLAEIAFAGREPKYHGLEIVGGAQIRSERCALWTEDQGCPLHGEACHD